MKEIAEKLIAELEVDMGKNIYTEPIPERDATAAYLGRIGALQLAILKIKIAFELPL